MAPKPMTERQLEKQAEHYRTFRKDPDTVFGSNDAWYYNTRDGDAPGTEIDMHNDEPIIMGEVNMDDSSESGSDGEETPEDIAAFKESIKKADTHAQLRSSHNYYDMAQKSHHKSHEKKKHHHQKNKKTHHVSQQGYLQFYDDNAVGVDQEEGEYAERVSLGSFDYSRLQNIKNQKKENSFSNQLRMAE